MDFLIDQEFSGYMFDTNALTDEELEKDILERGIKEPMQVAVIGAERILMDGHRRHGVAVKHSLPFTTEDRPFASREAALAEMDAIQLRRRNLNGNQESIVRSRLLKFRTQQLLTEGVSELHAAPEALRSVAESAGVSTRTVRRDEELAKEVDAIAPDLRQRAVSEFTKKEIAALAELTPDEQVAVVKEFDDGGFSSITAAVRGEESMDDVVDDPDDEPLPRPARPEPQADLSSAVALAQRALGKLKDALHDVNAAQRDPTKKKVADMHIGKISELLKAW